MPLLFKPILFLLFCSACLAQVQPIYLQLEEINSVDLIKYYPGQRIKFTTKEYPDAWRKEKIVEIIPEKNLIILTTGYITPEEIYAIERSNGGPVILGHFLSKFAAGWLVFGAYASLVDSGYKMSFTEVIIGAVAAGLGWLMRKLFGKKKYPMEKFYRLRIMDIRFPSPVIQTP